MFDRGDFDSAIGDAVMSFLRTCLRVLPVGVIAIACGGSDTTPVNGPGDSSIGGDAQNPNDSGAGDTSAVADTSPPVDSGACPDEHGFYSVTISGQGCGDLNPKAPQCIAQQACKINMSSQSPNGTVALDGMADLVMDGSFTMAAIKEGTVNRTGCVGAWDAGTSTLTVDCGGVMTSQSCRAVLKRTISKCP